MDAIIARIRALVVQYYPTILADLGINQAYLNLMVDDVVDRALLYMNRDQLIRQYELDLADYPDLNDEFWDCYDSYPIPQRIESVLARVVVSSTKTILTNNTADTSAIKSIEDNGQKVTYGELVTNYFNSSDDAKVFSSSIDLLKSYRLGTVVKNDNTRQFQRDY